MTIDLKRLSDTELMELIRNSDYAAFDELYDRYWAPIKRFLFSLTWDEDVAEDYLQEVFLRLYRARDRYQPVGRFSSYLYRIAKNYYLAQARKPKARAQEVSLWHEESDGFRPFENLPANRKVEPEYHLIEGYRRWRIRQAIDSLPERQKLVFVLSHFEAMKYDEIGDALGIPVGTVKSRMFTAVNTLKSLLKE